MHFNAGIKPEQIYIERYVCLHLIERVRGFTCSNIVHPNPYMHRSMRIRH